jgi:hypothetical protein
VLTAQVTLPGLSSSVPTARHFVESILTAWGHQDAGWTGALLVSELAANCALHARTEFSVRVVETGPTSLRIEVSDASPRIPLQRTYGLDATTGRGLRLVADLCSSWGVTEFDGGKTVWAELDSAAAAGDSATDGVPDDVDALLAQFPEDDAGPVARVDLALAA